MAAIPPSMGHGGVAAGILPTFAHITLAMDAAPAISFRKMNGLGNDFVVLDARTVPLAVAEGKARAIADRKTGIGCDQLIILEPSPKADVRMRIWNNGGDEVESCGNAARCIADILIAETGRSLITIDTTGGLLSCKRSAEGIAVDMGVPRFGWRDIPLAEEFRDTRRIELQVGPIDDPIMHSPSVVNVGNPHCIFWVKNAATFDLGKLGPDAREPSDVPRARQYQPCRGPVPRPGLASCMGTRRRTDARLRNCGLRRCGGRRRLRLIDRKVNVVLPGGTLFIEWRDDDHLIMTGPVAYEFEGTLPPSLASGLR